MDNMNPNTFILLPDGTGRALECASNFIVQDLEGGTEYITAVLIDSSFKLFKDGPAIDDCMLVFGKNQYTGVTVRANELWLLPNQPYKYLVRLTWKMTPTIETNALPVGYIPCPTTRLGWLIYHLVHGLWMRYPLHKIIGYAFANTRPDAGYDISWDALQLAMDEAGLVEIGCTTSRDRWSAKVGSDDPQWGYTLSEAADVAIRESNKCPP